MLSFSRKEPKNYIYSTRLVFRTPSKIPQWKIHMWLCMSDDHSRPKWHNLFPNLEIETRRAKINALVYLCLLTGRIHMQHMSVQKISGMPHPPALTIFMLQMGNSGIVRRNWRGSPLPHLIRLDSVWSKCTNVGEGPCRVLRYFSESLSPAFSVLLLSAYGFGFWGNLTRCNWLVTNTAKKSSGPGLNIIPLGYISGAVPVRVQLPLWKSSDAADEGRHRNRSGDTSQLHSPWDFDFQSERWCFCN